MWNNIVKTLLGGAGQGVQKIVNAVKPQPKPQPKTITQDEMMRRYTFTTPQPVDINKAIQSGGLRIDSQGSVPITTTGTTGGGGGGGGGGSYTPSVQPTIFRNSISSLLPKVYASDGKSPAIDTQNPLVNAFGPLATVYSGARQFLADKGIIGSQTGNFGQLLKNITNPHTGSWGTQDFGASEFFSPNPKGFGTTGAVNKIGETMKTQGEINLERNRGKNLDLTEEINRMRNKQAEELNKTIGGATGGSGGGGLRGNNNSAMAFSNLRESLDAVDTDTQKKLDDLYMQLANGQIDEETYRRQAAEAEAEANNRIYDQLIANIDAEVPLINQEFDTAKGQLESSIPTQEALAEKSKTNARNVYGDAMRKMVLNKEASMGNLRNMFSSLGTAESSAFINKAGDLEKGTGDNLAASERELADQVSSIDASLNQFKTDVKNKVSDLNLERLKQLKSVQDNRSMTAAQKAAKISEINANLYKDLVSLKQYHDQQTAAFIGLKQQLVTNTGDLIKNAMVSDSLYGRINPVQTYNSGVETSGNTRNTIKPTGSRSGKLMRFNPQKGTFEYYDPMTGQSVA